MSSQEDHREKRRQLAAANVVFAADGLEEEAIDEVNGESNDNNSISNVFDCNNHETVVPLEKNYVSVAATNNQLLPTLTLQRQQAGPHGFLLAPGAHPINPSGRTVDVGETQSQDNGGFHDGAAVMPIDSCRANNASNPELQDSHHSPGDWEDDNDLNAASVSGAEVTSPSSPESLSGNINNVENEDNPSLSVARPVTAFLAVDTYLVNATAIPNNRMLRPSHVIAVTLTCLVILGVVGISVYISSTQDDDTVPSPSPGASPTANTGDDIVTCFESTAELRNATASYLEGDPNGIVQKKYGTPIGSWCVDKITDFSFLFCADSVLGMCPVFNNSGASKFNEDISMWNTSLATNMSFMFAFASLFDRDISSWDVGTATDMSYMFYAGKSFNQNISSWDVSSVTKMIGMFAYADSFNQDISSWDVSVVTDMSGMFAFAKLFNQDISIWNVSSATDLSKMFMYAASFSQDVSSWDVSSVTYTYNMFEGASSFNQNISSWNVSSVIYMGGMFAFNVLFDQDISSWNVSSVTDMSVMFIGAAAFNQSLCSWGDKLNANDFVAVAMFTNASSCPTMSEPNLTIFPPGPFCYPCM